MTTILVMTTTVTLTPGPSRATVRGQHHTGFRYYRGVVWSYWGPNTSTVSVNKYGHTGAKRCGQCNSLRNLSVMDHDDRLDHNCGRDRQHVVTGYLFRMFVSEHEKGPSLVWCLLDPTGIDLW